FECLSQLGGLEQDVKRQVDANATLVRDGAGLRELVDGELGAVVSGIEACRTDIDGVGSVGDGGAHGVEGARGREQFGNTGHSEIYTLWLGTITAEVLNDEKRPGDLAQCGITGASVIAT